MSKSRKIVRFAFRTIRNVLSTIPATRSLLFPASLLAERFGPADSLYAWSVYRAHKQKLQSSGFIHATNVLEVGPGRNLGTALLWWADLSSSGPGPIEIWCWDVFPNAAPTRDYWIATATALLAVTHLSLSNDALNALREVARGHATPMIKYIVGPLDQLEVSAGRSKFDLIYSQAAIEHIWFINEFWDAVGRLSSPAAWQSHRIDLADHGSRETNYLEFLEWSRLTYWITMRYIPGACNRWRAHHHLSKLRKMGFEICMGEQERRRALPISIKQLSREYRDLPEDELRTTALDVVARRAATESRSQ